MIYTIKQFKGKSFTDKMDMVRHIKKNREELFYLKKSEYKKASTVSIKSELVDKTFTPRIEDISSDIIEVKSVINTTNVIDSHNDLHDFKTWNKTVADNPFTDHLESHKDDFNKIISRKARNTNEPMNFKDLGLNVDFKTMANCNTFFFSQKKNPVLFDAYKNGEVDNHSVGMFYLDLDIAFYDEDDSREMDKFEAVKALAINPEVADNHGFVWHVKQAGKREGSSVLYGSNYITPTLYVKNYEPSNNTHKARHTEPQKSTQTFTNILNEIKL